MFAATVAVMISPGTTATHRMPSFPYWVATLRVKPITAAFDVPYADRVTRGYAGAGAASTASSSSSSRAVARQIDVSAAP
jgi:hypothetical protein